MKVTIATVQAPFVRGGAEYLADSLANRLRRRGHLSEIVAIPFKWYPPQAVLDHMLACRLLRVGSNEPDVVVALKFPAYLTPFPNKKVWLLHQFRQVYELWGTPLSGMPDTPEMRSLRDVVRAADTHYLRQARRIFTNSKIVAGRLRRFNGVEADEVLYPPLEYPELFRPGPSEGYFFYPSRLNAAKRQHVAIEALRHTRTPIRLVLAGKPDQEAYGHELHRLVEQAGLQDRVTFLGWVSEEEKARWMSRALAAVYLPYDEDSYGYVTLEAFQAHKPVLTFTDCGGVHEVVEDGVNGLVVPPTPEALAEAMERLAGDPARARDLGEEAFATLGRHHIDWDYVLDRLLEPAEAA
jgi:glycosyltransferase involved in cell wall biosynthesis